MFSEVRRLRSLGVLISFLTLVAVVAFCQPDFSQGPPDLSQGPPRLPGMQGSDHRVPGVVGTITAIKGDTISIDTPRGEKETVKVTADTQFQRDRAEAELADFKVGDVVIVKGDQDESGVWTARSVITRSDLASVKARANRLSTETPNPHDMGKTVIAGEITKIEGKKLTIHRVDGVDQVIQVDDSTSFLNARGDSITLAEFKVGDRVGGRGALNKDVFVPTQLRKAPKTPGQQDKEPLPPLPPPPFGIN